MIWGLVFWLLIGKCLDYNLDNLIVCGHILYTLNKWKWISYQSLKALFDFGLLHPIFWFSCGNDSGQIYSPYIVEVFSSKQFAGTEKYYIKFLILFHKWINIFNCVQISSLPMCLIATSVVWIIMELFTYFAVKVALIKAILSATVFTLYSWTLNVQLYLWMKYAISGIESRQIRYFSAT